MGSTCTSKIRLHAWDAGFTLVELLVGLALSVSLALAVAPVWLSLEGTGTRAADRTVWVVQERVAVARLERDLRLAGAEGCAFPLAGPVLEASESQVVFLTRSCAESEVTIVEWEITGGSLMRRWGTCPVARPASYRHSLYLDNKTMLEDVGSGSTFTYRAKGLELDAREAEADLAAIDTVVLHLEPEPHPTAVGGTVAGPRLISEARVGR